MVLAEGANRRFCDDICQNLIRIRAASSKEGYIREEAEAGQIWKRHIPAVFGGTVCLKAREMDQMAKIQLKGLKKRQKQDRCANGKWPRYSAGPFAREMEAAAM